MMNPNVTEKRDRQLLGVEAADHNYTVTHEVRSLVACTA